MINCFTQQVHPFLRVLVKKSLFAAIVEEIRFV